MIFVNVCKNIKGSVLREGGQFVRWCCCWYLPFVSYSLPWVVSVVVNIHSVINALRIYIFLKAELPPPSDDSGAKTRDLHLPTPRERSKYSLWILFVFHISSLFVESCSIHRGALVRLKEYVMESINRVKECLARKQANRSVFSRM